MRRLLCILGLTCLFVVMTQNCVAQQEYVSRYDVFGSYSFLTTPSMNLFQRGFDGEFGYNFRRWVAIGGDYSVFTGNSTLYPHVLSSAVQQQLAPYLPYLPNGGAVPYNTTTQTFTAGPQFNYRKFKSVTLFVRPALGGLHMSVTAKPDNPMMKAIAGRLLGSNLKSSDTVLFYGIGCGFDLNASRHIGLRFASDFVWYDVFSNQLSGTRPTIRFAVGPTFRFGANVPK